MTEKIGGSTGFEPVTSSLLSTSATLYQLSYKATHWERGQIIDHMKFVYFFDENKWEDNDFSPTSAASRPSRPNIKKKQE